MEKFLDSIVQSCKNEGLNILYAQASVEGNVTEEYKFMNVKTRLNTMSMCKSFLGIAAGMALEERLISLEDKVCDFFPEYLPDDVSENLAKLRFKHLLTMTTGLKEPLFFADQKERYVVKDWLRYFLHKGEFAKEPGTEFLYTNFGTYVASRIIEKQSGANLLDYLRYRLFEPIGIGNPDWINCPMGHCVAANGFFITIDELSRFGEFLLNEGCCNGKQLVSKEYFRQATSNQTESAKSDMIGKDYQSFGYGYQFWMTPIPKTFLCSGKYGQLCFVYPQKSTVISILSLEGKDYKRIRDILIDVAKEL